MNLLTMIPIIDSEGVTTHFVGFQVDLVENPTAINAKNPGESFHACCHGFEFCCVGSCGLMWMV